MVFRPKYKSLALVALVLVIGGLYILKADPAGYLVSTPLADDKIVLVEPAVGVTIGSPLLVRGRARGTWFFEGSFLVTLIDKNEAFLAQGVAQAKGEWMTTEFVDFEATLTFVQPPRGQRGTLILHKDNPSGLPEFEDFREFTVYFK